MLQKPSRKCFEVSYHFSLIEINIGTSFFEFSLERSNGTANWNTFHAAAGSVTMLYKGKNSKFQKKIEITCMKLEKILILVFLHFLLHQRV